MEKEMEKKTVGKKEFTNPILSGFYPDPSICRVDEDYYMVCSTFEYFPGIPVFHSRDLLNWELINHCIKKETDLPYESVSDSGGMWAPTIRYYEGQFVVTATFEKYGNFIVTGTDPRAGWTSPIPVAMGGIDPSLYFEDGKAYYTTNFSLHPGREEITIAEVDIKSGKLLSEPATLWEGIGGGFLEAPHIYKKGDYYYLLAAEGGTNYNHMVTVARSKFIYGPYESCPLNPILTNVHDTSKEIQCSGHGDLVEDQFGNWWMVHLGIRLARRTMTHLGRETFLMPVTWVEEWPYVSESKKALLKVKGPIWAEQAAKKDFYADFQEREQQEEWMYLRNPMAENYRWSKGKLELCPSKIRFEDKKNPTFIGLRQSDFNCCVEADILFEPKFEGSEAGLVILLASEFHYRIAIRKNGDKKELFVYKKAEDFEQCAKVLAISEGITQIRVEADRDKYSFYYQDSLLCTASTRFLACEVSGRCFTGTLIGLYAYSEEEERERRMEVHRFTLCNNRVDKVTK